MLMESLRQLVRGRLGYNNGIYKCASSLADAAATMSSEGFATYGLLRSIERQAVGSPSVPVKFRRLLYSIPVRPGTKDADVLIDNVVRQEYGRVKPEREPRWMVDAGGYIGDVSAYFLSRYPRLRSIVLEPNTENYEATVINLASYGDRVTVLNKALWSRDESLLFSGASAGGSVGGENGTSVDCTSIPSVLEEFKIDRIDFLKMDIEGAEGEVLGSTAGGWLGHIGEIIIEIHGESLLRGIRLVLEEAGFTMQPYRSIWYCRPRR